MTATPSPYSDRFYTHNAVNSMKSARPILQIIHDLYSPTSIVDIGCGSGAWLTTAESLGFTTLRGYDGPWADPNKYTSPNIDFVPVDLEHAELIHPQRYDLAMSVEVIEHLSEARGDFMVDALCSASDVVLFGAAIPNQGGVHHINEMPQTYWIEKFQARGYEPFDIIRPAVWDNPDVKWWFRQNTVLFVKVGSAVLDAAKLHAMESPVWDLVHPVNYERQIVRRRKLMAEIKDLKGQTRKLTRQLAKSQQQVDRLDAEAKTSKRRVQRLEREIAGMRPARKPLSAVSSSDVPAPIRPAVRKAWELLPESARASLRRRIR